MVQLNTQFELDLALSQMKDQGFKYDPSIEDYVYKFAVYKYKKQPLIFCKIGIDEDTKQVWYTVCDINNITYVPFYDREYGVNYMILNIEKIILQELKKLGVTLVR